MSRDLQDETYYQSNNKRVPVKWTAPEVSIQTINMHFLKKILHYPQAIHYRKYSTQSDVWSFGAVLYEIWSVGYKPFENYTNREVVIIIITVSCSSR